MTPRKPRVHPLAKVTVPQFGDALAAEYTAAITEAANAAAEAQREYAEIMKSWPRA